MSLMDSTFGLVCLGLITLGLWIGLAALFVAFLQLRRTLRAVEALTYRLTESADRLHHVSAQFSDFADHVRSGWMKAFELAVSAAQTLWTRRPEEPAPAQPVDANGTK